MENEKSYRGMLVEVIVKSFIEENLFESVDDLKQILQDQLNLNLKFETNVSNIETKNGQTFGKISFDDESGIVRVIDFTITGSSDVSCSIKYSDSEEMIQIINQDGKVVFGGNYWDFDRSPKGFKRLFESLGLKVSMDDTYRYE